MEYIDAATPFDTDANRSRYTLPEDCNSFCCNLDINPRETPDKPGVCIVCGKRKDIGVVQTIFINLTNKTQYMTIRGFYTFLKLHKDSALMFGGIMPYYKEFSFHAIQCEQTPHEQLADYYVDELKPMYKPSQATIIDSTPAF